jgi:hypothetical protein
MTDVAATDGDYKVTVEFGSVELVQVQEVRGSQIWRGGYSIKRDREGKEISRTELSWNGYLECHTPQEASKWSRFFP